MQVEGHKGVRRARRGGLIGMAVVHGPSMLPTLRAGDRLLVRYGVNPAPGVLVLARFPDGTLVVKRVLEPRRLPSGERGWWLVSDHPEQGVDSRHRGPIADSEVLARVLLRVWPRPGRP